MASLAESALVEHLRLVPKEDRDRVADALLQLKIRDYDSLLDAVQFITSEVIRGNIGGETARIVKDCLELAFTAVAAKNKGVQSGSSNALAALIEAVSAPAPRLTSGHMFETVETEAITVLLDSKATG